MQVQIDSSNSVTRLLVKLLEQDAGHMCLDQLDLDQVDHYCLRLDSECLNLIVKIVCVSIMLDPDYVCLDHVCNLLNCILIICVS